MQAKPSGIGRGDDWEKTHTQVVFCAPLYTNRNEMEEGTSRSYGGEFGRAK